MVRSIENNGESKEHRVNHATDKNLIIMLQEGFMSAVGRGNRVMVGSFV